MALQKITERTRAESVQTDASVIITQDNGGTETLYRASIDSLAPAVQKSMDICKSIIANKKIKTIDNASVPAYVGTKTNGIITQTHTGSGNQWWTISFENTDVSSGFVRVKTTVDELDGQIQVYLFAKDATTGNQLYIPIRVIDEIGTYTIDIDLNYYVVYKDIDLNQQMKIGFANKGSELRAVYSMASLYDVTNDLEGTMTDVINTVNRKADSAINAANANIDVKLTDNNGDKYLVQVSNGNVVAVPLLPSTILYVGNSLLTGNGTFGMAASNSNEDYYHHVNEYIIQHGKTVNSTKLRGVDFENCTTTSAQERFMADTLLPQLNNSLELVIIQLGDNVNNEDKLAVFQDGAKALVRYIRTHAPNARVAWVGEWYSTTEKQAAIANACAEYGATFIDISDLRTVANSAAIGDVITYDDGTTTTIDSPGVASHPSSVGMRAIADRIIEKLF